MTPRPSPEPQLARLALLWRARAPASGRVVECALYRVTTGWELRTQRTEDDVIATELFMIYDEDAIAEKAATWIATLVAKGFTEITQVTGPQL